MNNIISIKKSNIFPQFTFYLIIKFKVLKKALYHHKLFV